MKLKQAFTRCIGLPLVDVIRKTKAQRIFQELRKSEFWSINKLESLQLETLKRVLIHCQGNIAYYRKLFHDYSFNPQKMTSFSDIQCLPVLTKDMIRDNFDQFKADNFSKYSPRSKETGGSTGEPLKLFHDAISHGAMWANMHRGFGYAGFRPGDLYVTLAYGSLRPKQLKFGMFVYFWLQNTINCPAYHLKENTFKDLIFLFNKKDIRYLFGYSSALIQFAKTVMSSGKSINGLKAVFSTSEMLFPNQRRFIEENLNAEVYDNYGCPEAGVMTHECTQHDGYHTNMETCFIEIVDTNKDGIGRIVSTNLTNYAFPIIRYDTGDVGRIERTGQCLCGRSHDKITSLLGRQRDVVTLPNGKMLHGAFFNHLEPFYRDNRINRYQIIQTDLDRIEIHLDIVEGSKMYEFIHIPKLVNQAIGNQVCIELIEKNFRESKTSKKHRTVISDVDNVFTHNVL